MGFLGEFAYGFSQAAKPILEAQAKANADADARIRERVQSVEPEAQLYQRQKDIDAATQLKERQQRMDMQMGQLHNASPELQADFSGATGMPISSPNNGTPMPNAPTPTVTQGTAPNMTPASGASPQPFATATPQTVASPKPADHMSLYNEYKVLQSHAFQTGDKEGAESYGMQAERHKTLAEHDDRTNKELNKGEPISTAEGKNVVEEISKDAGENDKNNGTSFYAPEAASVFAKSDSTMNWKGDKYYAETVHSPLAQAEMVHQRSIDPSKPIEEVSGLVKQNTLAPTMDIATMEMNNPHITPAQKMQALVDLKDYMKSTYGEDVDAAIAKDKNLQHVFNTKLLATMTAIANQNKSATPIGQ